MPADALIRAIEQDARLQCESLLRDAEEAAGEVMAAAEKAMLAESRARKGSLSSALDRKAAAAVNAARTMAAGRLLALRGEMAEEALRRAEQGFRELTRERYSALLKRLYSELKADWLEAHEPEAHIVLINPADIGLVEDPEAEFSPDEGVSLGVVFLSKDGRLRYENTVSSRITRGRDTLIPIVDRILSGGG